MKGRTMVKLPHVDPDGIKFRRHVLVPIFNNRFGYWYLTTIAPSIDRTVTPATHAWVSSVPGTPLLLMTHHGAKSGKQRVTPLMYFSRGDDVVLMASNYGRPKDPAWLANIRANPEVMLEYRGRRGRYRARVPDGAERDELWQVAMDYIANYRSYEQRAGQRQIRVVVCSPIQA
jgi:deazaflavin-dependent oxidoreductase (nitroreductase family)